MQALGPRSKNPHYLPTLDGWRTLAILSVLLCHDSIHRLGPLSTSKKPPRRETNWVKRS